MSLATISSQAFSPNKFSGLQLWLDASDLSTIVESGGVVSQWNDKGSNDNNATQSINFERPLINVNTINNLNALAFNGFSSNMTIPGVANLVESDYTLFFIADFGGHFVSTTCIFG